MPAGIQKKLYKIINNFTGTKEDNPMPPGDSDTEIAQSFQNTLWTKLTKSETNLSVYHRTPPS